MVEGRRGPCPTSFFVYFEFFVWFVIYIAYSPWFF